MSALIVEDGKVLLVKRGTEPNRGLWSLPGGSIEPGETVREAVAREVFEETSLAVEAGELLGVQDVISAEGERLQFHYVLITFRARVTSGVPEAGSDAAEVRWVRLDDLDDYRTTPGLAERLAQMMR